MKQFGKIPEEHITVVVLDVVGKVKPFTKGENFTDAYYSLDSAALIMHGVDGTKSVTPMSRVITIQHGEPTGQDTREDGESNG